MSLPLSWIQACLLVWVLLDLTQLNGVAADAPGGNAMVDLPEFKVTEGQILPEPEKWRYARIPGFEVLTNASDRSTRQLMADFERFQQALSLVWPGMGKTRPGATLILCGRKAKFDSFGPVQRPINQMARASLFLKNRDQTTIVIDLEADVVDVASAEIDDPAAGTDSSLFSVDHNKQLYREYVRYLLSQSEPRLPPWFEEGMAQIVMAMKFDRKLIEFGKLEDPNTVSFAAGMKAKLNATIAADDPGGALVGGAPLEDRDFNAALARGALIPFDAFFAVTREAPEANNPLGTNRWAKQAYGFVHLCLYGEHQKYAKPLAAFLLRATREPVTEKMFQECFHQSYGDMLMTLRGYIQFTNYKSQEFRIKGEGLPVPPKLDLRDATPAEVGRIKGAALIAGGHNEPARAELIAPYLRGERDPQLLAELGLYERANQHDDRALKFLEAAVAAQVDRPRVYLELSQLRLQAALALAGNGAALNEAHLREVLAPLLVGRQRSPRMPEIYEAVGNAWGQSAVKPNREDVAVLIEGAQFFPERLGLVYQAAALSVSAGVNDAATTLIDFGLNVATNPQARAKFSELKLALPKPVLASP